MSEAVYAVRIWVDPDKGADYLKWLHENHVGDVANFSGVAWAKKVRLEQTDEHGWIGVLVLYGFESRQALDAYWNSDLFKGFQADWAHFQDVFRLERLYGEVDLAIP